VVGNGVKVGGANALGANPLAIVSDERVGITGGMR